MKEAWLKCSLSNGMFPDEFGVSFRAGNGEDVSLFVFNYFVDAQSKKLRVQIVERRGDQVLVLLPVESLNGSRVVPVSDKDLFESKEAKLRSHASEQRKDSGSTL